MDRFAVQGGSDRLCVFRIIRTELTMAVGFAAMGFTEEQIDAFFTAAASL